MKKYKAPGVDLITSDKILAGGRKPMSEISHISVLNNRYQQSLRIRAL